MALQNRLHCVRPTQSQPISNANGILNRYCRLPRRRDRACPQLTVSIRSFVLDQVNPVSFQVLPIWVRSREFLTSTRRRVSVGSPEHAPSCLDTGLRHTLKHPTWNSQSYTCETLRQSVRRAMPHVLFSSMPRRATCRMCRFSTTRGVKREGGRERDCRSAGSVGTFGYDSRGAESESCSEGSSCVSFFFLIHSRVKHTPISGNVRRGVEVVATQVEVCERKRRRRLSTVPLREREGERDGACRKFRWVLGTPSEPDAPDGARA